MAGEKLTGAVGRGIGQLPVAMELLESTPHILFLVDGEMRLRWANTGWAAALAEARVPVRDRGRMLGGLVAEQFAPEDRAAFERAHADHLSRTGDRLPGPSTELTLHFAWSPKGGPVHAMATTVRGSDGHPAYVMYACCPWEPARLCTHETEMHRSSELTAVRRMASALSHEINNPLFIVTATLEDLLLDVTDEAVKARLQTALDAAWRIGESVNDVLSARRAGEG